jgi:hypothetical protein
MKKSTKSFLRYLDEDTEINIDWLNIEATEYIQLESQLIEKDTVYIAQGNLKLIVITCGLKFCSEIIMMQILPGHINSDLTYVGNVISQIIRIAPGIPIEVVSRFKLNSSTNCQIMSHWSKHDTELPWTIIPAEKELTDLKPKIEILLTEGEGIDFDDVMNDLDIDPSNPEDEIDLDVLNFNPWDDYYLRDFFGLLSDKEVTQEIRENEDCYSSIIGYEDFSDYELLYQNYEQDLKTLRDMESQKYFSDINVLLIYNYPYCQAFRIGKTIDECQYIGLSIFSNEIWQMIEYHLETGECDLHW